MIEIRIKTPKRECFVDISHKLSEMCSQNDWEFGVLYVFCPHTTCALTINENADPDVVIDIISDLARVIPKDPGFAHIEGNSDAHIKASLIGNSIVIFVEHGKPQLGMWQAAYLAEFDGPRERKLWLRFIKS